MLELKLVNFKNYEDLKVSFSPQLNCFVGMNGMGKTNLLEAIYYLCMTKSNFGTNDRQIVRQGQSFFRIVGMFSEQTKVVAKVIPGKQKKFERNDIPYDRLMEHIGARKKFITEFFPVFQRFYQVISNDAEQVAGAYVSKLADNSLKDLLAESEQKDRILMRTTVGIHRDDLKFMIGGNPLRKFGSQGQLKSFVLALKLAQFEFLKQQKERKPLLLLDDIFDKLDRHRVAQLIGLLLEQDFGQIFITDTHENRIEKIVEQYATNYRKFTVENGKIL